MLCVSCKEYDLDEVLFARSDVYLSLKGKEQYTFNPVEGQCAHNPEGTLYRYTDDNLKNYLEFKCDTRPVEGEMVTGNLKWKSVSSSGDETNLEFSVEKVDGNGMIWLWSETKNIGLIIKDF